MMQYLHTAKQELVSFSCLVFHWVKKDLWPWIKSVIEKSIPVMKQIWTLLVEFTMKTLHLVKVQIEKLAKKKKIEDKTNEQNTPKDVEKK